MRMHGLFILNITLTCCYHSIQQQPHHCTIAPLHTTHFSPAAIHPTSTPSSKASQSRNKGTARRCSTTLTSATWQTPATSRSFQSRSASRFTRTCSWSPRRSSSSVTSTLKPTRKAKSLARTTTGKPIATGRCTIDVVRLGWKHHRALPQSFSSTRWSAWKRRLFSMAPTTSSSTTLAPSRTSWLGSVSQRSTSVMWKSMAITVVVSNTTLHGPLWIVLRACWNLPKGYARCTSTTLAFVAVPPTTESTSKNWENTAHHCCDHCRPLLRHEMSSWTSWMSRGLCFHLAIVSSARNRRRGAIILSAVNIPHMGSIVVDRSSRREGDNLENRVVRASVSAKTRRTPTKHSTRPQSSWGWTPTKKKLKAALLDARQSLHSILKSILTRVTRRWRDTLLTLVDEKRL